MTYGVGNPGPGLRKQDTNGAEQIGSQPYHSDNWTSNDNSALQHKSLAVDHMVM
jgi:hypothetical protein